MRIRNNSVIWLTISLPDVDIILLVEMHIEGIYMLYVGTGESDAKILVLRLITLRNEVVDKRRQCHGRHK